MHSYGAGRRQVGTAWKGAAISAHAFKPRPISVVGNRARYAPQSLPGTGMGNRQGYARYDIQRVPCRCRKGVRLQRPVQAFEEYEEYEAF